MLSVDDGDFPSKYTAQTADKPAHMTLTLKNPKDVHKHFMLKEAIEALKRYEPGETMDSVFGPLGVFINNYLQATVTVTKS